MQVTIRDDDGARTVKNLEWFEVEADGVLCRHRTGGEVLYPGRVVGGASK